MNDDSAETTLTRLTAMQKEMRAPVNAILALGKTLHEEAVASGIDGIMPDVERIIESANNLSDVLDSLAADDAAEAFLFDQPAKEVARTVRHELRTPIAGIKGYGEILLEDLEDLGSEVLRPILLKLLTETNLFLKQLNVIVDFSNAQTEELPERIDLVDEDSPPGMGSKDKGAPRAPGSQGSAAIAGRARETGLILVADDVRANRDLLERHLTREGHRVTLAEGGRQALALADKEPFDLILLDLMMPDLDGFQVLARLKADGRLQDIPVIMISALEEEETVIKCIQAGAEDFLPKSFNPVLLRARIDACLERKHARDREKVYLDRLEVEKRKSEGLLLNILPPKIVERLNAGEDLIADAFENSTVLFSDLVGFTEISAKMGPSELVHDLNKLFSRFDTLAKELGVEKVKTIGDAYMVVSGLPEPNPDHVEACCEMALGMVEALTEINPTLVHPYEIRIGVHCGPVVAGIIGKHKFIYDVWGATVNEASRYESYSLPNHIHVSKKVALVLGEKYDLESRGTLDMRGIGDVETFFLTGRREAGQKQGKKGSKPKKSPKRKKA
ncbi:MAG: response regulator [Proteobacteria bacterium]|nr:response regulator [Pseudomonadota bacterium]